MVRFLNCIRKARQGRYDLADRLDNHNSAPNEYIAGRKALFVSNSVHAIPVRSCCDCGSHGFQEGSYPSSQTGQSIERLGLKVNQVTIRVGWPDPKPQLCAQVCSL